MRDLQLDKKYLKAKWLQFKFGAYDWYRTYILKIHDCDNCKYFGGLMCDHIDDQGKCLGWEGYKWPFTQNIVFNYELHKFKKKLNKKIKKLEKQINDSNRS